MASRKRAILAIDEGTSGTRAGLVAEDGAVSGVSHAPLGVSSPRHGVVEQDANALLDRTIEVTRRTIEQARTDEVEIVAMALATQRSTGVLWDSRTGRALVPAMVWQDTRYAEEMRRFASIWNHRLVPLAGRPAGARSPYLWAARHMQDTPEVKACWKARSLVFGTVDTWLLWHLSEARPHITTPTNAAPAGAYQLDAHRYLTDWVQALSFPLELLPELREDADEFGCTRHDVLGIRVPIKASCGDQSGGLVGLGCLEPGQAMCVHGSGSFVDLVIGSQAPANPGLYDATVTTPGWRREGHSHFAVETYAAATGSALNHLCSELRWFESGRQIGDLAATVASAEGLFFLPALTGLRQPRIVPEARASLTGLSLAHGRPHLAYAILEGIAHSVVACGEASEESAGIRLQEIVAGGGLSSSDVLLGIQADLSGVPVRRMADAKHASLRGAAFLAGSGGLFWNDLSEARATLPDGDLFQPRISAGEREERRSRWKTIVSEEIQRVSAGMYIKQEQEC